MPLGARRDPYTVSVCLLFAFCVQIRGGPVASVCVAHGALLIHQDRGYSSELLCNSSECREHPRRENTGLSELPYPAFCTCSISILIHLMREFRWCSDLQLCSTRYVSSRRPWVDGINGGGRPLCQIKNLTCFIGIDELFATFRRCRVLSFTPYPRNNEHGSSPATSRSAPPRARCSCLEGCSYLRRLTSTPIAR